MDRITDSLHGHSQTPITQLMRPVQRFMHEEASSGIVLFLAAVVALVWANSPWYDAYHDLLETHIIVGFGSWAIDETIHHWIDDGLMAIFFFVVGLEIKRAVVVGELSSVRKAALPIFAALGGMIVPALLYVTFNPGGEEFRGWGIPMATDIAFSLGVLSLLRTRAPLPLKIFLTAFAIIDDIGAVIVIAVFYTGDIAWGNLGIGAVFLVALLVVSRLGIRHPLVYAVLGVAVWLAFLYSGVHATVAGVLVAATIPIRVRVDTPGFLARGRDLLLVFERSGEYAHKDETSSEQRAILVELEDTAREMQSPLQRFETALHPWVAFVIMPLFALSNAGVKLEGDFLEALTHPVTIGIVLGLVVGKQVGVTLFSWVAVRFGFAALPYGVTWLQFYGVALLGGIGFTMSLFITNLAFTGDLLTTEAKIGILLGSAISGIIGYLVLFRAGKGMTGGSSSTVGMGK
ncbi:MAG: Na+/H+ antiporter NhaA [Dehalococcoidia bacterium]|nr:Na+/H+ antiporter NhaA [Dehalococcoidia bacterium]